MRISIVCFIAGMVLLATPLVSPAALAQKPPILITADLTDAPRKLYHADVEIPVSAGPISLTTPQWIPGDHRPTGPVSDITGVVFSANGQTLQWRRDVYGNLIYNNSAFKNPGEGNSYDEDGLYCDGCTEVTFERNTLYGNDLNIEAASETAGEVSSNVIIRNNLIYAANSCGVSVGGYAKTGTGGSTDITIVNNSLYDNDTQKTGSGEFQIQYRATGIVFENNIVYTGAEGLFMYGYVSGSGVTSNYNDFYTTSSTTTFELNGKSYSSFASYQSKTGQDANSVFANPDYLTLTTCTSTKESGPPTPLTSCSPTPNFDISTSSPAENTGNASLGSADFGTVDFNGNPRVNANGQINMGAYEQ